MPWRRPAAKMRNCARLRMKLQFVPAVCDRPPHHSRCACHPYREKEPASCGEGLRLSGVQSLRKPTDIEHRDCGMNIAFREHTALFTGTSLMVYQLKRLATKNMSQNGHNISSVHDLV